MGRVEPEIWLGKSVGLVEGNRGKSGSRNGHKCPRQGRPQRPCVDMMSPPRTSLSRTSSPGTSPSRTGPWRGHHVHTGTSSGRCPRRGHLCLFLLLPLRMSTQGRPRAGVPVEDIYVCFYFCPLVRPGRRTREMDRPESGFLKSQARNNPTDRI